MVVVTAAAAGEQGPGWSYATSAAGTLVPRILGPAVTGRGALDVPAANEAMARAARNVGRPGIAARPPASAARCS
ncbi:MAG: hypothetical protein ACLQDY_05685 [Streptosporangiaceae bacterium]